MRWPSYSDVLAARRVISSHLQRTPCHSYPGLNDLIGAEVWVKHENCQPTGAFKARGGVNLIAHLSEEERRRGVICASTGNHGQGVAYGARLFAVRAIVGVPHGANPDKVAAIKAWGADVLSHGNDFDDVREYVEGLAEERGYRYVHSGNEPDIIAGVATATLEILEDHPDIQTVIVPVGGGSCAAGACVVAKTANPCISVIGVQSRAAPAAYLAWKSRSLAEAPCETIAEGLATRTSFLLPQEILWKYLDDFVLVEDDELRQAVSIALARTHHVAEPAGVAALAGALALKPRLAGKKVALMMSGGNITLAQLRAILDVTTLA